MAGDDERRENLPRPSPASVEAVEAASELRPTPDVAVDGASRALGAFGTKQVPVALRRGEELPKGRLRPGRAIAAARGAERIPRVERVVVGSIDAVGTADLRAEPAPPSSRDRVEAAFAELRRVGPTEHGPLLQRLRACDPELVKRQLRAEFPGLLWFHRHAPHRRLPRGRDAGPLTALLFELSHQSVDVLVELLDDGNADQRYYAALVAADLAGDLGPEATRRVASALEPRIFDGDTQVRSVALLALRGPAVLGGHEDLGRRLVAQARDPAENIGRRLIAIRALGELRHVPATRVLIELLGDAAPELRREARQALRRIAVVDRGRWRWRWRWWAARNLRAGRVRWLLAALEASDPALRELAHGDLGRLTGVEIAMDAHAPRSERRKVRERYEQLLGEATGPDRR